MENINDVVETTENTVEQPVEQNVEGIELTDTTSQEEKKEVKMYSEEELNARVDELLSKKLARATRKLEREYENKYADYRDIGEIVSQGLNASNIKDAKDKVKNFYETQGIKIENKRSDYDERVLGKNDADEIIELGFEEMESEANKLADKGYDNLSVRDKEKFNILAQTLTYEKNKKQLKEMGVGEEILDDSKFKEFASQFNSKTPLKNIYEIYKQTQPKKEVKVMGSMTGVNNQEKEYYTEEELNRLTLDELADDRVWEKVRKSMIKS